jgi:glycosyltransferase involved in cell wall biosynthesis
MTIDLNTHYVCQTAYRVLFVDHAAVLGGAELSLLDLASAYQGNCKVLLFEQGPFCERLESTGISVKVIPASKTFLTMRSSGGLSGLKAFASLWRMARHVLSQSQGFDLIHANSQKAFITAALARWMGSPPVIWHLRDILTASHFSNLNRRLVVALANAQASRVIVNSMATGDAFVAVGGNPELVKLVYNGVSAKPFESVSLDGINRLRADLNITEDTPLVGCFSRLSYWKGQHVLLHAAKSLPDVHILLVGKALFGEEEYVIELKALANSPELAGRVHWLGFRQDIPELMATCTIIAHTSTEPEPFGRVIIEGQMSRRPVIATAAGGAKELIEDGKTGCLVPPGEADILELAIRSLLENPDKMELLAQQGFMWAHTRFSLAALLKNFDQTLAEVIARN